MIKGNLYRNKYQTDVDFYVTNVTEHYVAGYWILRSNKGIMNRDPDKIQKNRIVMKDWKKVING